jgi:hypothetical protein
MQPAGSQRFPKWLIQASATCGVGLFLYSAYRLPLAQVALPLLLISLAGSRSV